MSWLRGQKKPSATTKFEFEIEVHEVRPWLLPDAKAREHASYVLHWERGTKRSGTGRAVASIADGPTAGRIPFREAFHIPATLQKEHEKGSTQVTYQKKCVVLSLHEAHRDGSLRGSALGRAVLDLADYAALAENTSASQSVSLATGKSITKAVGTPMLTLTVRHFSKSAMKERERAKSPSSASQMSPKASANSHSNRRESIASSNGMSDNEEANKEKLISAILSDDEEDDLDFMTEDDLKDNKPASPVAASEKEGSVPSTYATPDPHGFAQGGGGSGRATPDRQVASAAKSSAESLDEAGSRAGMPPLSPGHDHARLISPNRPAGTTAASIAAAAATAYAARGAARSQSPLQRLNSLSRDRGQYHPPKEGEVGEERTSRTRTSPLREHKSALMRDTEIVGAGRSERVSSRAKLREALQKPVVEEARETPPAQELLRESDTPGAGNGREGVTQEARAVHSSHGRVTQEVEPTATNPSASPPRPHKSTGGGIYATVPRPPLSPTHVLSASGTNFAASPPHSPRMSHEKEYGRDPAAGETEPVRFWGGKSRQSTPERERSSFMRDRRVTAGSVADAIAARDAAAGREEPAKWVSDTVMPNRNAEADARLAEARSAASAAAMGLRIAEERAERAEAAMARMQAELLDAAIADIAVHGFPAYHGDSCQAMHTPARRIARAYAHVRRTQGATRAATSAHSAASALTLATRSSNDDIPRLLFWWSNCIVLRELVLMDQENDGFGRQGEDRPPSRRVSAVLSDRRESGTLSTSERRESGVLSSSERRESGVLAAERRESAYLDRRESGLLDPSERRLSVSERIERRQSATLRASSPLRRKSEDPFGGRLSRQTSGIGSASPGRDGVKVEDCTEETEAFVANLKHLEEYIHKKVLLVIWREIITPVLQGTSSSGHKHHSGEPHSPRSNGSSATSPLANLRNRYFPSQESNDISSSASANRRSSTSSLGFGNSGRSTIRARGSALVFPAVGEGTENPPLSGHKPRRYPGGTECIESWCAVFTDVKKRLCPARALGQDCGCLFWMTKLTLEQLAQMLDVALFNAVLRDLEVNEATDPITDPCTDPRVLPLSSGVLTFGGGVQLKIAVAAWTDWVMQITAASGSPTGSQSSTSSGSSRFLPNSPNGLTRLSSRGEEGGDVGPLFSLLRETADLLMLPKDMLMDKSARQEIFLTLTLPLIRRVIYLFVPDENTPEPLPPSLLAAFNAEVSMENRKRGLQDMGPSSCPTAPAANTPYVPPPSLLVREVIGSRAHVNQDISSRGYESDDELHIVEAPIEILVKGEEKPQRSPLRLGENPWSTDHSAIAIQQARRFSLQGNDKINGSPNKDPSHLPGRFRLLQQFWGGAQTASQETHVPA